MTGRRQRPDCTCHCHCPSVYSRQLLRSLSLMETFIIARVLGFQDVRLYSRCQFVKTPSLSSMKRAEYIKHFCNPYRRKWKLPKWWEIAVFCWSETLWWFRHIHSVWPFAQKLAANGRWWPTISAGYSSNHFQSYATIDEMPLTFNYI